MVMVTSEHIRRLTWALVAVTGVLTVFSYVATYTLRLGPQHLWFEWLHVGDEGNLPTWWNAGLLLMVALAAVAAVATTADRAQRRAWGFIALVVALLSLDEASRLHERSTALVAGLSLPTFNWVVVGAVVGALGGAALIRVGRVLPRSVSRPLLASLGIYLFGALVLESISGYFYYQLRPFRAAPFTHLEEVFEMGACILALAAILGYLCPLVIGRAADGPSGPQATNLVADAPGTQPAARGSAEGAGMSGTITDYPTTTDRPATGSGREPRAGRKPRQSRKAAPERERT